MPKPFRGRLSWVSPAQPHLHSPTFNSKTSHSYTEHPGLSPRELWGKPETSGWNEGVDLPEEIRHKQAWGKPPGPELFLQISHRVPHSQMSLPLSPSAPGPLGGWPGYKQARWTGAEEEEPGSDVHRDRSRLPPGWGFSFFNLLLNCCQHLHFLPELPGNPYEFSRGWCPSPSVTLSGKTTVFLWLTLQQMHKKACFLPGSTRHWESSGEQITQDSCPCKVDG